MLEANSDLSSECRCIYIYDTDLGSDFSLFSFIMIVGMNEFEMGGIQHEVPWTDLVEAIIKPQYDASIVWAYPGDFIHSRTRPDEVPNFQDPNSWDSLALDLADMFLKCNPYRGVINVSDPIIRVPGHLRPWVI